MKKGGIVVERMMAGALRADGQRRMIGDAMKETKLPKCRSGATRELTHSRGQLLPKPGRKSLCWLIPTVVLLSLQPGRGPLTHKNGQRIYCHRFLSTTLSPINATSTIHRRILPSMPSLALKTSSPQLHIDDCALTGRSGEIDHAVQSQVPHH